MELPDALEGSELALTRLVDGSTLVGPGIGRGVAGGNRRRSP